MKILYIGDKEIRGACSYQSKLSVNKSMAQPLIETKTLIDLDARRMDVKKLKDILEQSNQDIICRISKVSRIKKLVSLFDKVIYKGEESDFDLFETLRLIFFSKDREEVLDYLLEHKPPLRLLMKWIISNLVTGDEENIAKVEIIDIYLERIRDSLVYAMIARLEPNYPYNKRFFYRFNKDVR